MIRIYQGKVDTLIQSACRGSLVAVDSQALVLARWGLPGYGTGFWITTHTGARKIDTVKGHAVSQVGTIFKDHFGVVWIGLKSGNVLAIHGKDTVDFKYSVYDSGEYFNPKFAEDTSGNIWVKSIGSSFSIFVRGKMPVTLALQKKQPASITRVGKPVDMLGRKQAVGRYINFPLNLYQ
jgi:ligand-binding sensor domain-containing protein